MICAVCETQTQASPCAECGNDPLLAGTYRLKSILGRGAQGTTFLAEGPHGICAIKELQLGRSAGGKATELFHREAAVLSQLNHAQIPSLYDHFVDGVGVARSLYLVQQYVCGENLEERLKTHRFTETEVTDILAHVAEILTYLHGLSPPVIHRDIKPSNILLDDDGTVHLIDFGSVRDVMRDTVGGGSTVAGTFGYMAPEQLVGDATPRSDLYALGMTGLRLLTREMPTTLMDRQGRLAPRVGGSLSARLTSVFTRLVRQDSDDRLSSAKALIAALTATSPPVPATRLMPEPTDAVPYKQAIRTTNERYTLFSALLGRVNITQVMHIRGHLSAHDAGDIAVMGTHCGAFDSGVSWLSDDDASNPDATHPDHYTWKWYRGTPWRSVSASAVPVGRNTRITLVAGSPYMLAGLWSAALASAGVAAFLVADVVLGVNPTATKLLGGLGLMLLLCVIGIVRTAWAERVAQRLSNQAQLLHGIANEFVAVHPDPDDTPDERLPMEALRTPISSTASDPSIAETS